MSASQKRPNVVFIMADDMGYGDPGCYNPESLTPTPWIDRIASEGMRLTHAHSPAALCTPTRYGLLTGRYQWRTSKPHSLVMPYDPPLIPEERLTLASMFKQKGYATACVGKWHLGLLYREKVKPGYRRHFTIIEDDIDFSLPAEGGPNDLGFDFFFGTAGCSSSDAPYCFYRDKQTLGIPSIQTPPEMNKEPGVYPGLMVEDWDQLDVDTRFAAEAVDYLDRQVKAHPDTPFFLYLPLNTPHIPWLAPEFIQGASKEGPKGDMNALADWCVGQVYEKLAELGVLDDTILIYTSDHGPQIGQNGQDATAGLRGVKATAYEGGHRVPFVARWPEHFAPGTVNDQLISTTDMMATFADLLGYELKEDEGEDSISVLESLINPSVEPVRPGLIAHTGWHVCDQGDFSLQDGDLKLIEINPNPDKNIREQSYELYNLQDDPCETQNLARDQPAELQRMITLLNACRSQPGLRLMQASI
jgi:arylsulfatase A-like enzyme